MPLRLAGTVPVISDATHQPTGARFRLASLPDGFDSHTQDLGSMRDAVPTPEQAAAFLRGIQPGIGRALGGIDG